MSASKKSASPAARREQGKVNRLIEAGKATRWRPGMSGNPDGARRDYVTHHLRELLDAPTAKKLAKTLLTMAMHRNLPAIREVLDRADGKPAISIGGVPGEPIEITGDRIPPGLTHEEMHEYTNKRMLEIVRDWMDRSGLELRVRKKGTARSKEHNLSDLLQMEIDRAK
jgi:hypothetical protein